MQFKLEKLFTCVPYNIHQKLFTVGNFKSCNLQKKTTKVFNLMINLFSKTLCLVQTQDLGILIACSMVV
jgi:hypothetical protein